MNVYVEENWYKKMPEDIRIDKEIKSHLDAIEVAGKMMYDDFFFQFVHFHIYPKTIIPPNITSIKAKFRMSDMILHFKVPSIVLVISGGRLDGGCFYALPLDENNSASYPVELTSLTSSSSGRFHQINHHISKKGRLIENLEHLLHNI